MLCQNWFMNSKFEMFEDFGETQSFYDLETGVIYIVYEDTNDSGNTIIKEITEDSIDYKPNYERYKAFKGKKYKVKLVMSEEYTIEADNPSEAEEIARDKFGNNYLIEDVIVTEV